MDRLVRETDSNFSFHLSLWDRLLGSYRSEPRDGQVNMAIGLPDYRSAREQTLVSLLLNPLRTPGQSASVGPQPLRRD